MKPHYLTLVGIFTLFFSTYTLADNFNQTYQAYLDSEKTTDHQQTLELAIESLALGKAKYGESDANTINLTFNLATSYAAAKKFQNAFNTMEIVTTDYATRYGEYSENYFSALLEQLSYYPRGGASNLTKSKRVISPKAKHAIDIANYLSEQSAEKAPFYYYQLSRIISRSPMVHFVRSQAIKYTELAYQGLLESVGKSDYRTLESQFLLATIKTGTGKTNSAIALYEDLIKSIKAQLDTSHPYELAARSRLIELYEKKGESEHATEHCIEIGRMKPWEQDLDPTPLYRLEPRYPVDYARRSKEGWAKLSFSIDEMGFVKDIEIIDTKGGTEFGHQSAKVLEKWRYAPKFEDGQAVTAKKVTVQMDFKMAR